MILYHCTSEDLLETVCREGLAPFPDNGQLAGWGVGFGDPIVWLSSGVDVDQWSMPLRLIQAGTCVRIKINLPKHHQRSLRNIAELIELTQHPGNVAVMKTQKMDDRGEPVWPSLMRTWVCFRRIDPRHFREIERQHFVIEDSTP